VSAREILLLMCVGSEFQVDGAETENAREVKLLVMPVGLTVCMCGRNEDVIPAERECARLQHPDLSRDLSRGLCLGSLHG